MQYIISGHSIRPCSSARERETDRDMLCFAGGRDVPISYVSRVGMLSENLGHGSCRAGDPVVMEIDVICAVGY